jgi:HD-GYP domain-containing protein (c-di-GMP phosphodiesterase class II)
MASGYNVGLQTGTRLLANAGRARQKMNSIRGAAAIPAGSGRSGALEPKRHAHLRPQAGKGQPVPLESVQMVIGRGENVDHRVRDHKASRRHACVLAVHNRYYLQDLGSTNGTILNGNKITSEPLAHGDLVQIGGSVFRFEIGADLDTDYLKTLDLQAVVSLAEAVDRKDGYTRSHSAAVARIAHLLALELGLSAAAAERVGIAGRLHDIGKIGIPDVVLRKPGRLDDAELVLVRKHPSEAEAILEPIEFLADVLPAVRQHHERFDGRGYPDGLAGQAIAVGGRIIHVADTYHAMASRRPYRNRLADEFIRQDFVKHAGTQFDPEVTRALLQLLPSLRELPELAD